MNIALDYDDTFTRDPELWADFVRAAIVAHHDIRFVTFRSSGGDNADIETAGNILNIPIIYTAGRRKRVTCYEQGFMVSVWIDDMPEIIVEDRYDNQPIPQQLINLALEAD